MAEYINKDILIETIVNHMKFVLPACESDFAAGYKLANEHILELIEDYVPTVTKE